MGDDSPLDTFNITSGTRQPATVYSISKPNRSPWLEVAVNVRTPVAEAAPAAANMECSESRVTNVASMRPSLTHFDRVSTTSVCGVMG